MDHGVVRSWTLVYEDPDYWSAEKLITEYSIFKNVASAFGKSPVKDEKGLDLYLNGFDGDSKVRQSDLNFRSNSESHYKTESRKSNLYK